jgi:ATP-dependent Clp protease ATP-binding subunit ClpC
VINPAPAALELLAKLGYDPEMGARPLKRIIQQKVEDALSDALLSGEFEDGDTIVVDVADEDIKLRRSKEKSKKEKPVEQEPMAAG